MGLDQSTEMKTIIWEGKPLLMPYIIRSLLHLIGAIILVTILLIIDSYTIGMEEAHKVFMKLAILLPGFYMSGKKILEFFSIKYKLSKTSIHLEKGIIDLSIISIDKANIKYTEYKRDILDRFFNTATIKLYTGKVNKDIEGNIQKELSHFESIIDYNTVMEIISS